MSTTDPMADGDLMAEQATLGEFDVSDPRCTAIADLTGERCRHHAVAVSLIRRSLYFTAAVEKRR